jgi:hypothetical protein
MLRLLTAAFAAVAVLAAPAPSRGEDAVPPAASAVEDGPVVEVVTRSGVRFRGVVVKRDERRLHLRTASGVVRELPLGTVARIEEPREAPVAAAAMAAPADESPARVDASSPPVLVGIGVAIPTASVGFSGGTVLFLPIQIGSKLRLEPEFGYAKLSGMDRSVALIGLGVFATRDVASQVRAYFGPRLEYATSGSDDGGAAGVAVGGEWLPVPRVALGAEGRLVFAFAGGDDAAATSGLLFVRVFLN